MRPRRNLDVSLTPGQRWALVLFLLVILGLFAAEVFTNYQPAKLSALFFVLFWIPLLAFHEAGHALVAALLGWRVHRIVIGMGRIIWRFQIGATPVEVRTYPVEGFVVPSPTGLRGVRWKSALIYFAGPGAELLIVLLVALIVGPGTLVTFSENIGMIALQSLCIAALAGAILNLIPTIAESQSGLVANDGLGIIRSFIRPLEEFDRMIDPTPPREEWEQDPDWWKK
jgi:hypothetical protein